MNAGDSHALPDELQRVHMVGIGGAGMSGIARILLDRGGLVSGSDAKESRGVVALRARGAAIRIGHDESSLDLLPGGPTAVVTTHAAIPKTNPELVEARRRGIPVILRPVVLAKLMAGHTTLMVTGTHGKTTTTSMLIVALQHSGFDPSFAVGGDLGEAGTNAHHGSGDCFVAEADESDGSLLEYTPDVAVVTNIEADHLDFFGSVEAYGAVFDDFVERLTPGGALVVCTDDPGAAALAERTAALGIRVLRYGSDAGPGGWRAPCWSWEQHGTGAVAHIQLAGEPHPRVMRLAVPGRHMALNALGALLAAMQVGAPVDAVLDGLAGFEGVRRRFELVGTANGGPGVRRLRPPSDRGPRRAERGADGGRAGRQGRVDRGFPAPFVFAHKDFRPRVRTGAERRRRGVRARRLRGTRTTDRRCERGDRRRTCECTGDLCAGFLGGRRAGRRLPRSRRRRGHHGCG